MENIEWTLDIGVGEKPRGTVNLDIVKTRYCNMIADACNLPFRGSVFKKVWCSEVLEHLDNPMKGLMEISRVLTNEGVAEIDFLKPFFINNARYCLIGFILNFPFSLLPENLKALYRTLKGVKERNPRWFHKYIITLKIVEKQFEKVEIEEFGDILLSFLNSGRKAKYFKWKPKVSTAFLLRCKKMR